MNHIKLHELKSSKKASQLSRSVIDLALPLKYKRNTVTISLNVLQKASLNNKAEEVSNQLINMFRERHITFIDHTHTIDIERHFNKNKVNLSRSGTIEFAKTVC